MKACFPAVIFPAKNWGNAGESWRILQAIWFGVCVQAIQINKIYKFVEKLEKMRTLCTFCNNISEKDTKRLKYLQFAFLPVSVRKMVDKWQTQYYNKCINAFGWIECRISKLRQMRRLPFGLPFLHGFGNGAADRFAFLCLRR